MLDFMAQLTNQLNDTTNTHNANTMIGNFVQQVGRAKHRFSFRQLLEEQPDKQSLVLTFLAILEMMKAGQIEAVQEEPFGDITCEWHETADALDASQLTDY